MRAARRSRSSALFVTAVVFGLGLGCASQTGEPEVQEHDQSLTTSRADRACKVVIRSVARKGDAGWAGAVDVAADIARDGATVGVIVRRFAEGGIL